MHTDKKNVERRIKRFLDQRLESQIIVDRMPLEIEAWVVPDEPVPFAEAVAQEFAVFSPGSDWGKPWGTTWFHIQGRIPNSWVSSNRIQFEIAVDLGFYTTQPGFQAEATAYTSDGQVIKGIHPRNRSISLSGDSGASIDIYLEAASNPDVAQDWSYRPTKYGEKSTAGEDLLYKLKFVDLVAVDKEVYHLLQDFKTLYELMMVLPDELPRRAEILRALEEAIDVLPPEMISENAQTARTILGRAMEKPAYASAHELHAVGHAHIDSAWLWPIRETRRKVARTFSNALDLISKYDDFVFAASSAQQYKWIQEDHPELFERIRDAVKSGRFVPIGGMWIEPDSNLPSGESLTRQLLEGKRFFMKEFGVEPIDIWLPDSFGYSGAFPQIVKHAGSNFFLTQKISWNDTNRFPHHTFMWEGIDGTQVFTHFPPADTYNATISAAELHLAESQFSERGKSNVSLLPYGWGNGGGGPTREMVEAGRRARNLEGSPKVVFSNPENFFKTASTEYVNPPVWVGELYLELHRATSTTQARLKKGNRLSESLLREAELWWTHASIQAQVPYPHAELRSIWEDVLLLQFHDILPGTSIAWVHREAAQKYDEIEARTQMLIGQALGYLLGEGGHTVEVNPGPSHQRDLAPMSGSIAKSKSYSTPRRIETGFILENEQISYEFDQDGTIVSILDKTVGRELVPRGLRGNLLELHVDLPSQWDAWDVDASYKRQGNPILQVDQFTDFQERDKVGLRIQRTFGESKCDQTLTLAESSKDLEISLVVDWYENEKFLKLTFPFALHTDRATSEIQYGHLHRAIHTNTDWDAARFETVAHRWIHIGQPDYGVAISNNATYGYDISRHVRDGQSVAVARISVLRAPRFPDPTSDMGSHEFKYILRPNASIHDAISAGYELNSPTRRIDNVATTELAPLLEAKSNSVIIESVKMAEDESGDVILRMYESEAVDSTIEISTSFDFSSAKLCDSLEREVEEVQGHGDREVRLAFKPFQIRTLRLVR